MSYNLSSFTWTGWGEDGIEPQATDRRVGLDAARNNLRLTQELDRGDGPLCNGYWLLGAHLLTAGDDEAAVTAFQKAREHGQASGRAEGGLLAEGYLALTALLSSPDDADALEAFAKAKADLVPVEEGESYIQQLDTALRVLGEKRVRCRV